MENEIVVKKGSRFVKFLKIALAIAAVAFVAVKIYQKFFQKKEEALEAAEEEAVAELPTAEVAEAPAEEAPFEVSADAVIDNAENMEAEEEAAE